MYSRFLNRLCNVRQLKRFLSYSVDAETFQRNQISKNYLNGRKVEYMDELKISPPDIFPTFPMYRVLDFDGNIINKSNDPSLTKEQHIKMYKDMTLLHTIDRILLNSQRQGFISFYATAFGEEALEIGCSAGLHSDDLIYGQYREIGVLLHRGFTPLDFINNAFGNCKDKGLGRQMPVHFGSKKYNFVYISSPLATQIPQSVGSAYAFKRAKNDRIVCCFFGDGAASEGDALTSFNFAATLDCPVIFVCRNNGYAISTSTREQYRGDGIAARGPAFGLHTIRVDGNDVLAMYNATKSARELAARNKAVLVEAISYRIGDHSTSDDSTTYRAEEEVRRWNTLVNPIMRYKKYLMKQKWWSEDNEREWLKRAESDVKKAFVEASKTKLPSFYNLFGGIYKEETNNLRRQKNEFKAHLRNYNDKYPFDDYMK